MAKASVKTDVACQSIKEYIIKNSLRKDERIPTEMFFMEQLGVSRTTVRKALETLKRDGYVYSKQGSGFFLQAPIAEKRTPPSRIPLLLAHTEKFACIFQIIQGVSDYLLKHSLSLDLRTANGALEEQAEILKLYDEGYRNLMFVPIETDENYDFYLSMKKRGMNFTFIDRIPAYFPANLIQPDNVYGAFLATEYLIQMGHTHIAWLCLSPYRHTSSAVRERFSGYKQAMQYYHLPLDENDHIFLEDYSMFDETILRMLHRSTPLTAVVAVNDAAAIDLCDRLKRMGFSIPDTLSVVGFDNLENSANYQPALTTIDQPSKDMGYYAARTVLASFKESSQRYSKTYLPVTLIKRDSVKKLG